MKGGNMKKSLLSILLLVTFAVAPIMASEWTPLAPILRKSIAYLTGPEGSCTAFVIDSKREYVLTAAHCDQKDMFVDNIPVSKIVAKDVKKDLLVLEVKGIDRPALHLAKDNPEIGDEVASYGFGLALERPGLRIAHISDNDIYIPEDGIGGPFVMTDANFIGGQSGCPVINLQGQVVMIVQRGSSAGLGLGVGSETIKDKVGRYFEKAAPATP